MRDHFLYNVDVDVDEAFDLKPLRAILPKFGGARFIGGVLVDWVEWWSVLFLVRGRWA